MRDEELVLVLNKMDYNIKITKILQRWFYTKNELDQMNNKYV